MNKVVVVGHTKGLGAALMQAFNTEPGFKKVVGVSKAQVTTLTKSVLE